MGSTVVSNSTSTAAKATRSPVFRAFGLGIDPLEMAERVDRLRNDQPEQCALLYDVANRVLFVDHLRFEVGWQLEAWRRDYGDYLRFDYNLDALEAYLLCTCIDSLCETGAGEPSFPDWIRKNSRSVANILCDGPIESAECYLQVTKRVFREYQAARVGRTRGFVTLFEGLPTFVKEYMADTMVVIRGGLDPKHFTARVNRWRELDMDARVRRIARLYLWARRRSSYTHRTSIEGAPRPGSLRRAQAFDAPDEGQSWWNSISFQSDKDPDKVALTAFVKGLVDEGFLLRAIVAMRTLTNILGYAEPGDDFLLQFFRFYATVEAAHALLHEMRRNREYLGFLSAPEQLADYGHFDSYPLPMLSTSAGARFLQEYRDALGVAERFLASYLEQIREANKRLSWFNVSARDELVRSHSWRRAIAEFCDEPGLKHLLASVCWYDEMIRNYIRGALETGQMVSTFKSGSLSWPGVWRELCQNVSGLPRCPSHPEHPHVDTLVHGVRNDILQVSDKGITLRSHRSLNERFVPASLFEAWCRTLQECRRVSLASPPRTEHSRVVGAILAAALAHRLRVVDGSLVLFAG